MPNQESHTTTKSSATVPCVRLAEPSAPSWVEPWLAARAYERLPVTAHGPDWTVTAAGPWVFAEVRRRDTARPGGEQFEQSVTELYDRLHQVLREHDAGEPLRFWNYIPRIHGDASPGFDRYMAFNVGRHRAFETWYRSSNFHPRLVAASAVGSRGDDLVVQVLAGLDSATPIENPRQRPAYRYSRRYGAVPPSFARASLIEAATPGLAGLAGLAGLPGAWLFTAGTASVVGEDSRHEGDLDPQMVEIETNLAALVAAATGTRDHANGGEPSAAQRRDSLRRFKHVRAYVVRSADEPRVMRWAQRVFRGADALELMPADLCRQGLLVEVEGVAQLNRDETIAAS